MSTMARRDFLKRAAAAGVADRFSCSVALSDGTDTAGASAPARSSFDGG